MSKKLEKVRKHWERKVCGSRYGEDNSNRREYFEKITKARYELEPYILEFADFPSAAGKRVLEIGVGAGSDFQKWCHYGKEVVGVDLTKKSIQETRERLKLFGILPSDNIDLRRENAEDLSFESHYFDIVYSWGVLHHTTNPKKSFLESYRVLKEGGTFKAMVYHVPSWTGWLLWLRYGLFSGNTFESTKKIIYNHLESYGTRAYNVTEIKRIMSDIGYSEIDLNTRVGPGDSLDIKLSNKYDYKYEILKKIYPSSLIRKYGDKFGLYLTIRAVK